LKFYRMKCNSHSAPIKELISLACYITQRPNGNGGFLSDDQTNLFPYFSSCLYCLKQTKFGPLILRKIVKIVAIRCQILRLKCTKFDFGCGSLQHFPIPLAGFEGPTSEEREGRKGKGKGTRGGGLHHGCWGDGQPCITLVKQYKVIFGNEFDTDNLLPGDVMIFML